jgi:5-formyltetrahydrofolate cyclo-ligase
MEAMAEVKKNLRATARQDRALSPIASDWLHLVNCDEFINARTIASYISYGDEPTTQLLNQKILDLGKSLVVPQTNKDYSLTWISWDGKASQLKKNSFFKKISVLEPTGPQVAPGEIDMVIVPALLVDRNGVRLGQGGGSYDRALAEINGWKVALVYSHELVSGALPHEEHDIKVNAAATPLTLIRFI